MDSIWKDALTGPKIFRRFAMVGDRRAHYVRAGEGPPCLLIHSSPANLWLLRPQLEHLSRQFTCFAFDSPGFGDSEPLKGETLEIGDLADAIAANMEAIGLGAVPVFGTHTGAAIAVALARRRPDKVTGLVLDGVPLFTSKERADLFDAHFETLQVDDRGGHFAQTWTRFRDQTVWFPWRCRSVSHQNDYGMASPDELQFWAESYFACGRSYGPAYRAVIAFGATGAQQIAEVVAPVLATATETDMLYPHLDRFPPLRSGQEIRRVGRPHDAILELIFEGFARFASLDPAPAEPSEVSGHGRVFLDFDHGQMHVRTAGDSKASPLLYLHDLPGSARRDWAIVEALAQHHFVIAPDLPGCADSDPLPEGRRTLREMTAVCLAVCRRMGASTLPVYGHGFGAAVAVAAGVEDPAVVCQVIVRGLPLADPIEREEWAGRMAPPITIERDGAHWYRTWLMLRDSLIYFPWFTTERENLLRVEGDFSAETLHDWTFDVIKKRASYGHAIDAVLAVDVIALLQQLKMDPVVVLDGTHRFSIHERKVFAVRTGSSSCAAIDSTALSRLLRSASPFAA